MNYFVVQIQVRHMRQELKEYGLLWHRPERLPYWHPEVAGDLKSFEEVDQSKPITDLLCIEKEIEQLSS